MNPDEAKALLPPFLDFAKTLAGDEKSEAQIFLDHLFRALGHAGAKQAGATFEYRVAKKPGTNQLSLFKDDDLAALPRAKGGMKFADLLWPGRVVIEMKSRGEKLERHYDQLFNYWSHIVPQRPPYAILCNFDEFWIYDFNQQLFDPVDRIRLADLPQRYNVLGFLFKYQVKPLFENNRVEVTRQAADHLAAVFHSLVLDRPASLRIERTRAQRFILQMLVGLVSEDLNLLPDNLVTRLLEECLNGKGNSFDLFGGLFQQMNNRVPADGGRFKGVAYFNGGLFSKIEPIDLRQGELERLRRAADQDWSQVRPEIFGTLFQHSMDGDERHAHGAHFTSEVDISKVIEPTIARPWRERIEAAGKSRPKLRDCLRDLRLYRVLDPACGSGNFLYIAFRVMKRLERDILIRLRDAGEPQEHLVSAVSPLQIFGMDILPTAVEIARVTLTLAKELEIIEAEKLSEADGLYLPEKPLPLDNLDKQIQCADALFTPWPKADAIIGNPPFQSKNKAQKELGADYLAKLRSAYPGMPGRADFCVYWFRKAHDALEPGQRAGLVGTNTIRQNYSREGGLDYIVQNGGIITDAVSTQVWSGEAVVHVSIANWIKQIPESPALGMPRLTFQHGDDAESPWETFMVPVINAALSLGEDVTGAKRLSTNMTSQSCYQGQTHGHAGFLIDIDEAQNLIQKHSRSVDVVFPFLTADELIGSVGGQPSRFVLDFGTRDVFAAKSHAKAFAMIQSAVLPTRQMAAKEEEERNRTVLEANPKAHVNHHHANFLKRWWRLSYGREELMSKIASLPRYIVCGQVTKRPIFEFISPAIHPNAALVVFPLADDYSFGVLQSSIHFAWFKARCSTLKGDYRYTSDTVFDTFPWPQQPTIKQLRTVKDAAVALRALRNKTMRKLGWSLRELYRTLELPGANPLRDAQDALDTAVRNAYGMGAKDDVLAFLLALNLTCAAKEKAGENITAPGLPLPPEEHSEFITSDCIQPPELSKGGSDESRAAAAHFHSVLREDPGSYGAPPTGSRA